MGCIALLQGIHKPCPASRCWKGIGQTQHAFVIEINLSKFSLQELSLSIISIIYGEAIMLFSKAKSLEHLPLWSWARKGTRKGCSLLAVSLFTVLKGRKEGRKGRREECWISKTESNITLYVQNPKDYIYILVLINKFSKVIGYKIIHNDTPGKEIRIIFL